MTTQDVPTPTRKRILKPLMDRVVLQEIDPPTVTSGGIIVPDKAVKKTQQARVLAVGPEVLHDSRNQPVLKPGDCVLVDKYTGMETRLNNETYLVVREKDILAKILDIDGQPE